MGGLGLRVRVPPQSRREAGVQQGGGQQARTADPTHQHTRARRVTLYGGGLNGYDPVDDSFKPNRSMIVEIPPILLRPSNRSDRIARMDKSRMEGEWMHVDTSPKSIGAASFNVDASEYTKVLDTSY